MICRSRKWFNSNLYMDITRKAQPGLRFCVDCDFVENHIQIISDPFRCMAFGV